MKNIRKHTRSVRVRALLGVPTPIAINLTPIESKVGFASYKTEESFQLKNISINESKNYHCMIGES